MHTLPASLLAPQNQLAVKVNLVRALLPRLRLLVKALSVGEEALRMTELQVRQ